MSNNAGTTNRKKITFTVNNTSNVVIFTADVDCFVSCQMSPGSTRQGTVFYTTTQGLTNSIFTPDSFGSDAVSQEVFLVTAGTVVRCSENQSGGAFTGILHVLELD